MENLQMLLLAGLQGFTEFLPVSSSGHLILFSKFTTFPDQGQAMDVAMHLGSAIAILLYFAKDIWAIVKGLFKTYFIPTLKDKNARVFWLVCLGTIPAVIAGFTLKTIGTEWLRDEKIIGWTILGFGILLFFADKFGMKIRKIEHLKVSDVLIIGVAQCLALVPGTSRSGITITFARFLGMERSEAAKFSMFLAIPAIIGASVLVFWEMYQGGTLVDISNYCNAVVYSFGASLLAIYLILWWVRKSSFLPFVIYRIALGSYLLLM